MDRDIGWEEDPPSEELRLCSFFSSASLERPFFTAAAGGAIGARPLRCELAAWEAAVSLFHNEESDLLATTNQTRCKQLHSTPSFAFAEGRTFFFSFGKALSLSTGDSFTFGKEEEFTASSMQPSLNESLDDSALSSVRRGKDVLCVTGRAGPQHGSADEGTSPPCDAAGASAELKYTDNTSPWHHIHMSYPENITGDKDVRI